MWGMESKRKCVFVEKGKPDVLVEVAAGGHVAARMGIVDVAAGIAVAVVVVVVASVEE